jgi:hypothetical protein
MIECEKCGESFVPRDKKETMCLFCTSLPEYRPHKFYVPTNTDSIFTCYSKDPTNEFGASGRGLTGQRAPGTAMHGCCGPRAPYRFKSRLCSICSKKFDPTGPKDLSCPSCKPTKAELKEKIRLKNRRDRIRRGEIQG